MFINSGATEEKANELAKDIISKTEEVVNKNLKEIKNKYSKVTLEDAKIISSYTCESKETKFNPYKILNKNLVSDDRKEGLKNVSKYLYIFLKSLRKLDKYFPNEKQKYLYRCINKAVNINYDIFKKKLVPYIVGNIKTFWGFTSTSPDIEMTYNFLDGEENNKCGTIFTLSGKIWGYDITLFNYYNEKEILLEPERKFKIDEVIPPINNIIHIRCEMEDNALVLNDDMLSLNNITVLSDSDNYDYILKFILVGDSCAGKTNFLIKCIDLVPDTKATVGVEFGSKLLKIKNKIVKLQIWDTAGEERYRSITNAYYRGSSCAILLYNIEIRKSFDNISKWIEEIKNNSAENCYIILVGNDVESENKREVSFEEGKMLADKYGIVFYEASSLNGDNIDRIFYESTYEIIKKKEESNNNIIKNP